MKKKFRLQVDELAKDELAFFERIKCKIDDSFVEVMNDCREWDAVRNIIDRHSQNGRTIVWDMTRIFTEKELMRAP